MIQQFELLLSFAVKDEQLIFSDHEEDPDPNKPLEIKIIDVRSEADESGPKSPFEASKFINSLVAQLANGKEQQTVIGQDETTIYTLKRGFDAKKYIQSLLDKIADEGPVSITLSTASVHKIPEKYTDGEYIFFFISIYFM